MVNHLLVATGQDPLRRETARTFFTAYLANKVSTRAASTAKRYRAMSDRFLAHLGPRADQPLRHITAAAVRGPRTSSVFNFWHASQVKSIQKTRQPGAQLITTFSQ